SENATTPKGASDNSPLADLLTEDELHEKTRIVPRDRMFNKSFCRPVNIRLYLNSNRSNVSPLGCVLERYTEIQ
ncbi:MAG: hypothetical protein RIC12_01850, partial [Pirellulales bacterium]